MQWTLQAVAILAIAIPATKASATQPSGIKILTPEEARILLETGTDRRGFTSAVAEGGSRYIPQDRGGNYGDLIYRYRETGDVLLLREVVVIDESSPSEVEVQWYGGVNARRISSVRVLNIGRERAFCARIDVAGAEAAALLRLPPRCDPRVLIEIYGF